MHLKCDFNVMEDDIKNTELQPEQAAEGDMENRRREEEGGGGGSGFSTTAVDSATQADN